MKDQWKYYNRAVDKQGNTIDFLLTEKYDKKAVLQFFKKAINNNGKPSLINVDKSGANNADIKQRRNPANNPLNKLLTMHKTTGLTINMLKSKQAISMLSASIIAIILFFSLNKESSSSRTQYIHSPLERGNIKSYVATSGTVTAVGMVEVGSQLSGQILSLHSDFNEEVIKDQILAKLDPRTFEAKVRQDTAQVDIAKANLTQQHASQFRAEIQMKEAKRQLDRQVELIKSGHVSQSDTDRLQAEYDAAMAQLKITEAQVANAHAVVTQRNEALFQSQLNLERSIIRSPVDGTVIDRSIEIGQTVAASFQAPTLFTIAQDLREMQVEASVDEADIGKIRELQVTQFTVDAYPDSVFRGKILQIRKAPTEVQNVITYKVIISAPNPDLKLLPGMTANVEVTLGEKNDVLLVPNSALRFKPRQTSNTNLGDQRRRQFNPEQAVERLHKTLELSAQQKTQIFNVYQESFKRLKDVPAWRRQREIHDSRKKINSTIRNMLSASQKNKFDHMQKNRHSGQHKYGEIWILDGNNQPQSIPVRIGLSDDDNTEIQSKDLNIGDKIIIRSSRQRS